MASASRISDATFLFLGMPGLILAGLILVRADES